MLYHVNYVISCYIRNDVMIRCHIVSRNVIPYTVTIYVIVVWLVEKRVGLAYEGHDSNLLFVDASSLTVLHIHSQTIVGDSHEIAQTAYHIISCHIINKNSCQCYCHDECVCVCVCVCVRTYMSVLTLTTLGIFNPFKKHFTSGIPVKKVIQGEAVVKSNAALRR